MTGPTRPAGLQGRALVGLGVRGAVGLVLAVAGWIGARGQVALDRQSPWIAVGVSGLLVGVATGAVWLLALRREVTTRTLALVAAVEGLDATPDRTAAGGADGDLRVRRRGAGVLLFHRPGCALVAGRAVQAGDAEGWRAEGLAACEACGA